MSRISSVPRPTRAIKRRVSMMTESTSWLRGKRIKSDNYHGSRGMFKFFVNIISLAISLHISHVRDIGTSELPAPRTSLEVPGGSQLEATEVLVPLQAHASLESTTTLSTSMERLGSAEPEAPQILAGPSVPFQRRRVSALRPTRIIKDSPWM